MTAPILAWATTAPLFKIGTINLRDLLQDAIDDATAADTPEGYNVLPPRTVGAGEKDLSELGEEFEVEACESLDFLSETDVFVFGVQDFRGQGFNFGYRCEEKRDVGGMCLKDNVCKSGQYLTLSTVSRHPWWEPTCAWPCKHCLL